MVLMLFASSLIKDIAALPRSDAERLEALYAAQGNPRAIARVVAVLCALAIYAGLIAVLAAHAAAERCWVASGDGGCELGARVVAHR